MYNVGNIAGVQNKEAFAGLLAELSAGLFIGI